jgi:hypothetical protein
MYQWAMRNAKTCILTVTLVFPPICIIRPVSHPRSPPPRFVLHWYMCVCRSQMGIEYPRRIFQYDISHDQVRDGSQPFKGPDPRGHGVRQKACRSRIDATLSICAATTRTSSSSSKHCKIVKALSTLVTEQSWRNGTWKKNQNARWSLLVFTFVKRKTLTCFFCETASLLPLSTDSSSEICSWPPPSFHNPPH